ncbi:hypothetical protein BDN72DRAFT_902633 [Pluteus cervinus]|uniref:Uncharacterized protein n=1 Tax=Pluteus cervinus TaxID=181527 RepID=A0ACD3ACQ8_9AGAR|nr:hypothetical protein BDN72DRAFT_902633 [Pluteus cervinus]
MLRHLDLSNASCPDFISTIPRVVVQTCFLTFLFGLPNTYFNTYQARLLPSITDSGSPSPRSAPNIHVVIRWLHLSERLKDDWKKVNRVSLVLLPLNASLLQINDITSWEVTRTTSVLSLWFSLASLFCGYAHTLPIQDIYETLLHESKFPTLMFWDLWVVMTLPASFAICSILTLGASSFASPSGIDNGTGTIQKVIVSTALMFIGLSMLTYLPVLQIATQLSSPSFKSNRYGPNTNEPNPRRSLGNIL